MQRYVFISWWNDTGIGKYIDFLPVVTPNEYQNTIGTAYIILQ